jgi:hypothetical protein
MMKVYDGYTNKEFNRNYEKFQRATILFWSDGISKPQSHKQQMKFGNIHNNMYKFKH